VIINLLSNAVKYSPEKTVITVGTPQEQERRANLFQILITDQGYGFTPEELAVAMQPFGRIQVQQDIKRMIKGTGLGLFISKNIVEQHGGTLQIISSGPYKGSTVIINLPL
jgi:two-component system sensor histidine kinase VicK